MQIVLLEVSHWHTPLYLDAVIAGGDRVVAVSDGNAEIAGRVAARFGARVYGDWRGALEAERPDFAFAFGRHAEMPALGTALIDRGIPFVMEKPCGTTAADVRQLRDRARAKSLFVGVPLVQSLGPLAAMLEGGRRPLHAWFRFIAGPPTRYPASGSAWMLDPAQSGGGCFINLSGHFLDLALRLLPRVTRVSARTSNAVYGEQIEDYALATLESPDGGTAVVETGYLYPSNADRVREVYYSLFDRDGCRIWWGDRGGSAFNGRPWMEQAVDLDSDPLYPAFVAATLAAYRAGRPAPVGLDAMVAVMELIEAAYGSARTGQPVRVDVAGY